MTKYVCDIPLFFQNGLSLEAWNFILCLAANPKFQVFVDFFTTAQRILLKIVSNERASQTTCATFHRFSRIDFNQKLIILFLAWLLSRKRKVFVDSFITAQRILLKLVLNERA